MNKKLLIFLLALLAVVLTASVALAANFPDLGNYTSNDKYNKVTFTYNSGSEWEDSKTWETVYTDSNDIPQDFQNCFDIDVIWDLFDAKKEIAFYYIKNFSDDVPALANFVAYMGGGGQISIWSGDSSANDSVTVSLDASYFEIPFPGSNIVASFDLAFQTKSGTNFTVSRKVEIPNSVNFVPNTVVNINKDTASVPIEFNLATDCILTNGILNVGTAAEDYDVTLNIPDDCHIFFKTINLVTGEVYSSALTISGDKGIIGPEGDGLDDFGSMSIYLTNRIFVTNSISKSVVWVYNKDSDTAEVYFNGTLKPKCKFIMQENTEIILTDPKAYFAMQNVYDGTKMDTGIIATNATVTLGTEDSEPVSIDLESNDIHQSIEFKGSSGDATLNLETDVTFYLSNTGSFFTMDETLEALNLTSHRKAFLHNNEKTLTFTAENVTSSADIYGHSIMDNGNGKKLYLKGVNLVLVAAPSEVQGDGSLSFQYKPLLSTPSNIYLEPDLNGNPSTFTAGTKTLYPRLEYDVSSDKTTLMGLFLSGDSTANFAKDSFNKWLLLSVDAQSEVTFSGDAKIAGLAGSGTVITEQDDGEYLTINGTLEPSDGTIGFNAFTGSLTANNVMFGKDSTTYPFTDNKNVTIKDTISIMGNFDLAGTFDNIKFYLKAVSADENGEPKNILINTSADNAEAIGFIGSLYAIDDLTIDSLYVDAGNSEDIAKLSAADGKTFTINEAFFYANADSTNTPYDNLRAVQIGLDSADNYQNGTVFIKKASGGQVADSGSGTVGVAEDAIELLAGTLFISSDIGDSNITVEGGTLEVANGVTLPGSLTFQQPDNEEVINEFVTNITSTQRNGDYAVKTNGDLTIEGNLSVDVKYDLNSFNGAEVGDEYRILRTNGTFTTTSAIIASEKNIFSADIIEASSDSGVSPGVILRILAGAVPVLGQASIEGPSDWNKIEKWSGQQFWFSVPVEGIDGYLVSKDGDSSYYLKANPVSIGSKDVSISDVTIIDGELSFKGTFSDVPKDAAEENSFTIQIGLSWDNNPETSEPAVANNLMAFSFVNLSYDVVLLRDILNSSDIIAALHPAETPDESAVDEYSTAEVLAKSNPEVNPFDEEIVFTVNGLTASSLRTTSNTMELVNGIYQPKDTALNPITLYSLPVENGTRTFDEIQVLVNGSPVENGDASVDVSVSPAEVTVKVSALGYNGEMTVDKELAVRGVKTADNKKITTETVKFTIVSFDISSSDISYDVVPEETLETKAIANASGDVIDCSVALDAPTGFQFIARQIIRFIIPLPEWLEYTVTSDSITFEIKRSVLVNASANDARGLVTLNENFNEIDEIPVNFAVRVVDPDGNVSWRGYKWVISVVGLGSTEYRLEVSGDVEAKVKENELAKYSLLLRVEPAPQTSKVSFDYDASELPTWLKGTVSGSILEFTGIEGASDDVGASYEFEVFASVDAKALAPVSVKIEIISGDAPLPSAPKLVITPVSGSLTPEVRVGVTYELILRTENADHYMIDDSEDAPEWLNFKENGEIANFSIKATEAQLADSPHKFVVHAYAGNHETSADLVITVVSDEVPVPSSPDVPAPSSPDVPTTYTLTGFNSSSDVTVYAGARFSIPVTITGTAPSPTWTATVNDDAFTVEPTTGTGKTFTLTGTAPTTAGTYQITLRATYGNLTPITKTVTLVVNRIRIMGSSGGCDAGFGALALLLATPLFLRKRK